MNRLLRCTLQPRALLAFCWPRIVVWWSSNGSGMYWLPGWQEAHTARLPDPKPNCSLITTLMCAGMRCLQPVGGTGVCSGGCDRRTAVEAGVRPCSKASRCWAA